MLLKTKTQKDVVRPERFELPTFWFVAVRTTLPNLARGVANRTESASWGKFQQLTFSFLQIPATYFLLPLLPCAAFFAAAFRTLRYIFVTVARFRLQRRIAAVIRQIVVPCKPKQFQAVLVF